jgi:hypothetical protein
MVREGHAEGIQNTAKTVIDCAKALGTMLGWSIMVPTSSAIDTPVEQKRAKSQAGKARRTVV